MNFKKHLSNAVLEAVSSASVFIGPKTTLSLVKKAGHTVGYLEGTFENLVEEAKVRYNETKSNLKNS